MYRSRAMCRAHSNPRGISDGTALSLGRAQRNRPRPDRCGSRLRGWARPLAATSRSAVPPVGLERTHLLPYRDRSQHRLESSPGGPGMPGDPRRTGSVPPVIADAGPVDRCAARPEQRVDPARGSPAARAGEAPAGPSARAARACRTSRPQRRRAGSIVAARPLWSRFLRPPAPPHTRPRGSSHCRCPGRTINMCRGINSASVSVDHGGWRADGSCGRVRGMVWRVRRRPIAPAGRFDSSAHVSGIRPGLGAQTRYSYIRALLKIGIFNILASILFRPTCPCLDLKPSEALGSSIPLPRAIPAQSDWQN